MAYKGIDIKPSHKGELHAELGVPQGQTIPAKKLAKALDSGNAAERKRAQFAENAKHFSHSGGGKRTATFARKASR
jgi:hypothetical protein